MDNYDNVNTTPQLINCYISIDEYNNAIEDYKRFAVNIKCALKNLFKKEKIKYYSINYRIKSFQELNDKIKHRNDDKPWQDFNDVCSIKIICYLNNDIIRIKQIINNEFLVLNNNPDHNNSSYYKFGTTLPFSVIKIKNDWLTSPNFMNLEKIKAKIEIRTLIMSTWEEIENKLAYKKKSHIPQKFKRKLCRISNLLEIVDEDFSHLLSGIREHKKNIINLAHQTHHFNTQLGLNLDNLQTFLDFYFPNRKKNIDHTVFLLDELIQYDIKISQLDKYYQKVKEIIPQMEKELFINNKTKKEWSQVGITRNILTLCNDEYFNKSKMPQAIYLFNLKWRTQIRLILKE